MSNSDSLSLKQANALIASALAKARAFNYRPMAVVVVDDSGNMKAMQREDGASMFRVDVARGKAWACVAMGASSRVLTERAAANPNFFNALAITGEGKFIPQTGGVLIMNEAGRIIGAVGASGGTGDEDEIICLHGLDSVGLKAA